MKIRLPVYFFFFLLLLSSRGYSQTCTLSASISQSESTICSGNSITLTGTAINGTGPFTYLWNTGETTQSILVNKAGTYTVTITDKTPGCSPVKTSVTITSTTTPDQPTAKGVVVCPNSSATLTATAPGGNYQWYDGAGNFLFNGASYTTQPITVATTFYVETTIGGCTSNRSAVSVTLASKPNVTGASLCAGGVATLLASGGDTYAWYPNSSATGTPLSTSSNFTTPVLNTTTTYYVVSTSNGCASTPTPVTATVNATPQPPTSPSQAVCAGGNVNLHADAPSGIFNWYNVPTGGTPLISSPDYTTPALNATTTYYVENIENDCVSGRTAVTVTVTQHPAAPDAQTQTICYQTSTTLNAGNNTTLTYEWYDAASGGNLLYTGKTYNTPVLTSSTTYYVELINGDCASSRAAITVTVDPQIFAPTSPNVDICPNTQATLTATAQSGTFQWYDAPTGGNLLSSTNTWTTPVLTVNTTYYVQNTVNTCVSPRAAVTVTVLSPPGAPIVSNTSVCYNNSAVLSASSPTNTYAWYAAATGGTSLSTAQIYATPALTATTTYYVETTNTSGCVSARAPLTVTVNPIPPAPSVSGTTTICAGTAASLTANAPGGQFQWYNSATGGSMVFTGSTYNTPVLMANATYYVENVVGTCEGPRTAVTVTVTQPVDPQFEYPTGTICTGDPNPVPVIYNSAGGIFSAAPAGLVFVSTTTGVINTAASVPGVYEISFAGNGTCAHTSTSRFGISSGSNAIFSYSSPFCQYGLNPLPDFPANGSSGTFSATPGGLVFVNATTGQIDLSKSSPGTYTVTNTITASGGCPGSSATATVTIDEGIIISAGPSQTVEKGTPVQLAGSISGSVTTGKWSGGTGTFSPGNSSINAIYTPGAGETTVNLTLTSDDPGAPCGAKSSVVVINFVPPPASPTIQGPTTTCDGTSTTLFASAPGGTYEWFTTANGTTPIISGATFTTPWLTQNTTYYVQTTVNGLVSNRTAVLITVDPVPVAPTVVAPKTCAGSSATLTATNSTGIYQWYDAAAGGNLLYTGATYVTEPLQVNTSYYVQAEQNNCTSPRTEVDVPVSTIPFVTSGNSNVVCTGTALNYAITSDAPLPTASWSRAGVAGISNSAVNNQNSNTITETLVNTTNNAINVTYVITPFNGTCQGPPFNYVVTVNPQPTVTGKDTATVCNQNSADYQIKFSTPVTSFNWSRAAVNGISNVAVSAQQAATIEETLFNTTNAPIVVPYIINYQTTTCTGTPFTFNETVNPTAMVTSSTTGAICSGVAQAYAITSNVSVATYTWSRNAVNGISNAAATSQSSNIDETLINTSTNAITVTYSIVPTAYGCNGANFTYKLTVNPVSKTPVANSNSPVCKGNNIQLYTAPVANATYLWTAPNGTTYTTANVTIPNATAANAGTYTLVITNKQGCPSAVVSKIIEVDDPGIANAGPPQTVCSDVPYIQLAGQITGGPPTGIWSGGKNPTGFSSPNSLNTVYYPVQADIDAGGVTLTLTSTSLAGCSSSLSSVTITFGQKAGVAAGPYQEVCSQINAVQLAGKTLLPVNVNWTSPTGGKFLPSSNIPAPMYVPTAADIKNGSVLLTLNVVNGGVCIVQSDTMSIKFVGPPVITPGGVIDIFKGGKITLNPIINENNLSYLWAPDVDISSVNIENPVITGDIDRFYTLTVTDSKGCQATDTTYVKVSPNVNIPNTFSPNGDGINDVWDIKALNSYPKSQISIFNRYGALLFASTGYATPWDGTYHGKPVPTGTYYYIIDLKNGKKYTGYVEVIR